MEVNVNDIRRAAARILMQPGAAQKWRPEPHQVPPPGDWYGWLLLAGRGAGKTDACAAYVNDHVNGPPCMDGPIPHWIGIGAPTLGDAATACFSGPSGIRAHNPDAKMVGRPGGLAIIWPNGSEAKLFGAHTPEDVERLRAGGNRCLFWAEELAAWRYIDKCWDHMRFGLRVGRRPHWVASTTPKPLELIKKLSKGEFKNTIVTRASTFDNPHLEEHIREMYLDAYGATSLGAQELYGLLNEQDENALWTRAMIDDHRADPDSLPPFKRVEVGVDPSGGKGEQGIVVVAKHEIIVPTITSQGRSMKIERHGFVLADQSCNLPPEGWGRRAVQAAIDHEADAIVVEINFGGAMASAVLQGAADDLGVSIPIDTVHASRGKRVRAEPVSALSTRGRWHHVGRFEELEDQMCTWTPESDWSPDRLDAMVWPPWHMKLVSALRNSGVGSFGGSAMSQQILK